MKIAKLIAENVSEPPDLLAVATAWRKIIWRQAGDDTEHSDRLVDICTKLCDGNAEAGVKLATAAIWNPA